MDTYSDRSLIQQKRTQQGICSSLKNGLVFRQEPCLIRQYGSSLRDAWLRQFLFLQMAFPGEEPSVSLVLSMWQNDNQGHKKV